MGLCVEAVALSCIIVAWWNGSGEIQTWFRRPTVFLQSFDTVGLVIWSVKIVPEMTYNVLSGTLSLYSTTIVTVASRSSLLALKQVDCTRSCKPDSPTKSLLTARPGRLYRNMLELMTVRKMNYMYITMIMTMLVMMMVVVMLSTVIKTSNCESGGPHAAFLPAAKSNTRWPAMSTC